MAFPNHGEGAKFDIVRWDRVTDRKEVLREHSPVCGRWKAEAARKSLEDRNRDPNIVYQVQPTGAATPLRSLDYSRIDRARIAPGR